MNFALQAARKCEVFQSPHIHSPRPSVMLSRSTLKSLLTASLIICSFQISNAQNDAGQLGFTALQGQANTLVENGKLIEAMPLLKESCADLEKWTDPR